MPGAEGEKGGDRQGDCRGFGVAHHQHEGRRHERDQPGGPTSQGSVAGLDQYQAVQEGTEGQGRGVGDDEQGDSGGAGYPASEVPSHQRHQRPEAGGAVAQRGVAVGGD